MGREAGMGDRCLASSDGCSASAVDLFGVSLLPGGEWSNRQALVLHSFDEGDSSGLVVAFEGGVLVPLLFRA